MQLDMEVYTSSSEGQRGTPMTTRSLGPEPSHDSLPPCHVCHVGRSHSKKNRRACESNLCEHERALSRSRGECNGALLGGAFRLSPSEAYRRSTPGWIV